MADSSLEARGGWAYVSLLSALPGIDLDPRTALAIQFGSFEIAAIVMSAWYDVWEALPLATVAILVSTGGSGLMLVLTARIRDLSPPEPYRRTVFDSSIDVVMGLVAFITLLTYLLVVDPGPNSGAVARFLTESLPAAAVFLGLFIAWDVCYRIGTAWWVSVTGLWRTVVYGSDLDEQTRAGYLRIEVLTIVFAMLQLLLVPVLWSDRLLAIVVLGHVGVVFLVSALTAGLLLRGSSGEGPA